MSSRPRTRFSAWAVGCAALCAQLSVLASGNILTIAAASDLKFALDEIVEQFQKEHPGSQVQVSYGSSGNFYAQLSQRAPFDLFLSADILYAQKLIENGHGITASKFTYAVGRLVVWAPTNAPADPAKLGMKSLMPPGVRKIAITDPEHAPYGRAAVAALTKLGLPKGCNRGSFSGKTSRRPPHFFKSGAADWGNIRLSLGLAPPSGLKDPFGGFPGMLFPPWNRRGEF